ncbi:MAG: SusD/RagB family nutrient-binding outer membrane lipoprotein [Marinoscillum sp.]
MKNLKAISRGLLIGFLIVISSCDFGDTNVDPSRLDDVPVSQLLPVAQAQTARNLGSIGARISGVVVQHFEGISAQPLAYNSYILDENSLDDYWRGGLYAGAMKDCAILIEKGKSQDIPYYVGIGKVLMAINLNIATTFWGDVPYAEAFQAQGNLKPTYDGQEAIYGSIQALLDEALDAFNADPGEVNPGADDLIFGGQRSRWIATARALKARYYMHLSKRDPDASGKALEILKNGTISANSNQPSFPFGPIENEANPIAFFGLARPNQLGMNPFFLELLNASNDPRKALFTKVDRGTQAIYVKGDNSLYWGRFESPMPLISFSELLFIRAEANLRLNILTLAQTNLDNAIRANMEQVGVSEAHITTYLTNLPELSTLTDQEARLKMIIEEKYKSMFCQGTLEAWVDYRRTGYPELTPAPDASESFNPSKIVPQRYLYPISERNTNRENMTTAMEQQGGHLLDQTLWAFQ